MASETITWLRGRTFTVDMMFLADNIYMDDGTTLSELLEEAGIDMKELVARKMLLFYLEQAPTGLFLTLRLANAWDRLVHVMFELESLAASGEPRVSEAAAEALRALRKTLKKK